MTIVKAVLMGTVSYTALVAGLIALTLNKHPLRYYRA